MLRTKEQGTIFFYILLAIALFAGLTYAITNNNRQNTSGITGQQARLAAQEIIDYGNDIAAAVQKLKLRGCAETEVSFENSIEAGYVNANAPADRSCHVFDLNGGAVEYQVPLASASGALHFNGSFYFEGVGSAESELYIGTLVSDTDGSNVEVCRQINNLLGIENPGGNPPVESFDPSGTANFTGTYVSLSSDAFGDDVGSVYAGRTEFCTSIVANTYSWFKVLIAR